MKKLLYYLSAFVPALLIIFILSPAKAKGQDAAKKEKTVCLKIITDKDGNEVEFDTSFTLGANENLKDKLCDYYLYACKDGQITIKAKKSDDGLMYLYCSSKSEGEGESTTIGKAKTVCVEDDGTWTVTTEKDGEIRVIMKSKKEGESEGEVYIIKTDDKEKSGKKK